MCLYCEGKYQIVLSKAVVLELLSWSAHEGTILAYIKAILGKNCLCSHSCHFVKIQFFNQTPSCLRSMCLHCEDIVLNYWIKSCGRSWWAHEGTIYAYTKAILGKKCLSSRSYNFVNFFFWTKFLHAYVQCIYIVEAKYQIAASKAVVGVDRPIKAQ